MRSLLTVQRRSGPEIGNEKSAKTLGEQKCIDSLDLPHLRFVSALRRFLVQLYLDPVER
jgi:hypothetical protein